MSSPTRGAAEVPRRVTNPTAPQPVPPTKQATAVFPAGPTCMEIPVRIQGSQVILHGTTEHPEFFEEDTNTLMVFSQGAVIRLAASVKAGQTLALTNQKTSEDVLCLVVNVRNYPSVKNYVEIEFTRAAPTFWRVNVPAKPPAAAPAPERQPVVPVPMAAPKLREATIDSASPAPSASDSRRDSGPASGTPVSPGVQKRSASLEPASFAEPAASSLWVEPKQSGAGGYYAPSPAWANERVKSVTGSERSKRADGANVPATATLNRPGAPAATVESKSEAAVAEWAPSAASHVGEDNSRGEAPRLSPDAWELNTPASSRSSAQATRSATPQSELEERPIAASSSAAAAASVRMAGVAARPFQDLRKPLGRFKQAAALGEHSWLKLVLRFAYTALFLSVVGGGAISSYRQFETTVKTAAVPSAVAASVPSPSTDAPQPRPGNDATQTQPIVSPDIGLSARDQRPAPPAADPSEEAKEPADMQRPLAASNTPKAAPAKPQSIADQPVPATEAPAHAPAVLGGIPGGGVPGAKASSAMDGIGSEGASAAVASSRPPISEAPLNSLRVSGEVKAPQLLHSVQPEYPVLSRQDRVEGDVTVQVDITATGKVARAKAVSGPVVLRQAAVDALRQWSFKPATVSGKPVPIQMLVTVKFQFPK